MTCGGHDEEPLIECIPTIWKFGSLFCVQRALCWYTFAQITPSADGVRELLDDITHLLPLVTVFSSAMLTHQHRISRDTEFPMNNVKHFPIPEEQD